MKSTLLSRASQLPTVKRLLLAATFSGGISYAQPASVQLPAAAHGSAAISALGDHLPDVAKAYGLRAQDLVTLFKTQPSLGVDRAGVLLVACDGLAVAADGKLVDGNGGPAATTGAEDALTADSSVTAIASGATVDAFKLHSLPGATRVILLDFNGHTTSGTSWNSSYTSSADIVSAPFDLDGDPTTFNATERALIQKIWQRVAEDYAPFRVDVTTEDPGTEALRRIDANDANYGIRVVISPTNWYNTGAGGVAYIGAFNWNSDTPCFAFSAQLANGEKYIAEAVSHEVGHTLGLYHDGLGGTAPTQYYQGQGSWAPIMGVGYYKSIVQFSKGEYANANNLQDDLAIITTGYIPLASDDHGNTRALATILSGPDVATGGTIETRGDVDLFRFDAVAGAVSFTLKGPAPDSNLDLKVELLDADENVLLTSDLTTMSATIATTVTGGTYYLRIDGIGVGDPVTTGYSDYGSIGNYIITGSFPSAGTKQAPVAAITVSSTSGTAPLAVSFSGLNSTDADGSVASYQWNFGNGSTATGATASATYSAAGTYAAVLTVVDNDGLAGSATISMVVSAPANVPPTAVATASTTSGTAPVPVTFSSAGSSDPDGSIAGYKWDFGDGTTSTAASPSKTYATPGNYAVKLTVTDNAGASATSGVVAVSVLGSPDKDVDVYGLVLSARKERAGTTASAAITLLDRLGRAAAGATVTVQWSGAVGGTSTGKTDAAGKLVLSAQRTKKTGTATVTIASVAAPVGGTYVASLYAEPLTKSITLP